eukprot:946058-Prorocentrum_minimum.AAC.4
MTPPPVDEVHWAEFASANYESSVSSVSRPTLGVIKGSKVSNLGFSGRDGAGVPADTRSRLNTHTAQYAKAVVQVQLSSSTLLRT